jgi:hypothetical protein
MNIDKTMQNEQNEGIEVVKDKFDEEFHPDQVERTSEHPEGVPEAEVEEEVQVQEEAPAPEKEEEAPAEDLSSLTAQKAKWREKAEKAEQERKALEAELNKRNKEKSASLDVDDYIDISTSLDGLDQREKAYLAEQHRLSGKPLNEIRESEDFKLWDTAYQQQQEAERALTPNAQQAEEEAPKTLTDRLKTTQSIAEKEELLRQAGLYKEVRPRSDRSNIGVTRSR